MPHKYAQSKGWHLPKQKYKLTNWSEYNNALKNRGRIDFWMTECAISQWYESVQENIGDGKPQMYTDFAIMICHQVRQVYKQPLRQAEGFINSLFELMNLDIKCPHYSVLSKRLKSLGIKCPMYTNKDKVDDTVEAIAIDSTGLKIFGKDEWHQEKHNIKAKRSWHKLHIAVTDNHYIHGCELTNRFICDENVIDDLFNQIDINTHHISADGAYDCFDVYESISNKFPDSQVAIPPHKNATINNSNHKLRSNNLELIDKHGRMHWQKKVEYGRRNNSELAIQRYKRILGKSLHSRDFNNQHQEAMIGASILNKMTSLGMPHSHKCA